MISEWIRRTWSWLILLGALSVLVFSVWMRFGADSGRPPVEIIRSLNQWESTIADGHTLGDRGARVIILEFGDFECPYCRRMATILDSAQRDFAGQVTVVYRHLPLVNVHPYSFEAAVSSECAAAQGKFARYYHVAFARQAELPSRPWHAWAEVAGVPDMAAFDHCVAGQATGSVVRRDIEAAEALRLGATPSIAINGSLLSRPPTLRELRVIVRRLIQQGA